MSLEQIDFRWRGPFDSNEVESLHAQAFEHDPVEFDWERQLERHSLGWVTARTDDRLVGFVNLAWDGGDHAFALDTIVAGDFRRSGVGRRLVAMATEAARDAGCEWLHVDFDEGLEAFYFEACGFESSPAGLIEL